MGTRIDDFDGDFSLRGRDGLGEPLAAVERAAGVGHCVALAAVRADFVVAGRCGREFAAGANLGEVARHRAAAGGGVGGEVR